MPLSSDQQNQSSVSAKSVSTVSITEEFLAVMWQVKFVESKNI